MRLKTEKTERTERIGVSSGVEEIEVEMVIRGAPPHWCSCKCPEHMRDPCMTCEIREVISFDRALLTPEESTHYIIPRSEVEKILVDQQKKGGE